MSTMVGVEYMANAGNQNNINFIAPNKEIGSEQGQYKEQGIPMWGSHSNVFLSGLLYISVRPSDVDNNFNSLL